MLKIAIIDSGIKQDKIDSINQVFILNRKINEEKKIDFLGHGTAMLSIIKKYTKEKIDILSIRLGTNNPEIDPIISPEDLSLGIRYAVDNGAKLINISMGININIAKKAEVIREACNYAFYHNVLIVTTKGLKDTIVYPWASENVLRVELAEKKDKSLKLKKNRYGMYTIYVHKMFIRGDKDIDKNSIYRSNSAATAYISALLLNSYQENNIMNTIEQFLSENDVHVEHKFNSEELFQGLCLENKKFNELKYNIDNLGKCIITPFNKEIESIIRYSKIKLVAILDIAIGGKCGCDPYKLLNIGESNIKVVSRLDSLNLKEIDTLVIGYIDKVSKYDSYFNLENLINIAFQNNLNIYSFLPLPDNIKKQFRKKGLNIWTSPVINKNMLKEMRDIIKSNFSPTVPILSVFGTSSKQGKLTLQIALKKELEKRKIKVSAIGTEHQSSLIGFDYCYPFGYGAENNIQLILEEKIEFLSKLINYIEINDIPDLIMIGGQSRLLPYNIQTESCIENIAFLEAIKPDCAILVINPYIDSQKYIEDTISCLNSIFKCRVIMLAFSNKIGKVIGNSIIYNIVKEEEKKEIMKKLYENYKISAGCIKDDDFIQNAVDSIINFLTD